VTRSSYWSTPPTSRAPAGAARASSAAASGSSSASAAWEEGGPLSVHRGECNRAAVLNEVLNEVWNDLELPGMRELVGAGEGLLRRPRTQTQHLITVRSATRPARPAAVPPHRAFRYGGGVTCSGGAPNSAAARAT
jgi:hypothetical protein